MREKHWSTGLVAFISDLEGSFSLLPGENTARGQLSRRKWALPTHWVCQGFDQDHPVRNAFLLFTSHSDTMGLKRRSPCGQ